MSYLTITRRIRRYESETAAQIVLEHEIRRAVEAERERVISEFHGFISVKDRMPEESQDVEVTRNYRGVVESLGYSAYGCRFGIERTTLFNPVMFTCDALSTGYVTHWRPAESWSFSQSGDYKGLDSLIEQCRALGDDQ